jgi:acetolactate decarboxylase
MKKVISFLIFILLFASCVNEIDNVGTNFKHDDIYQYSSKNGLLNNDYIGDLTVEEIKEKGDFGLGTFNMVDGEMVIFDGNVYQVSITGEINLMPAESLSPFVVTKFFYPDTSFSLPSNISLDSAKALVNQVIENLETPLAIKMTGTFNSLLSRSVKKVPDYSVTLAEIIENQTKFNLMSS